MCQEFPKEKWIDAQKENVLDAPYYHVVFTVPEELNPIIYSNQKLLYDALYHAASVSYTHLKSSTDDMETITDTTEETTEETTDTQTDADTVTGEE